MPISKRPETEIHYEVHDSGHPLLPIRRVTEFHTKHTPR